MRSVTAPLGSLLALVLACSPALADEQAERIARVEAGLRAVNVFEGDPAWTIEERMRHYGVPGAGVAVIENGRVAWFRVYGVADRETGEPVRTGTLFQAGSVSKPVAAFGAMRMVQDGRLDLDGDVNEKLRGWKLPPSEAAGGEKVTLGRLASHTAGLTVHGFPGYAEGAAVPTLEQVLDGVPPANTAPIRIDQKPGDGWRYSGGGYTVMQQMMIDVAERPFPELMRGLVLRPAGMKDSSYAQPLPERWLARAAAGVLPDGTAVAGKRHVYPEMAAAGLWTTARDLALFATEVQRALRGESKLLSRPLAEAMVEPVVPHFGRGFGLEARGDERYFEHGGWDAGFCAQLTAHRDKGYGAAITINSNHPAFIAEVLRAIAFEYGWAGYDVHRPAPVPDDALARYPGRYRYNGELTVEVRREGRRLLLRYVGGEGEDAELVHVGDGRFLRRERSAPVTFPTDGDALALAFERPDGTLQTHARLAEDEHTARELLAAGDYEAALAAYRALEEAADAAGEEGYLNGQGLQLAYGGRHALAIELLKVNCELYPGSANTWDSVGLAYRLAGDTANAITHYKKALEVDPTFPSALEALAELDAERTAAPE